VVSEWREGLPGPGDADVVLSIGIGDVIVGDIDDSVAVMQTSLHEDSEKTVGPMRCRYTSFTAGNRDGLAEFLRECDLPADAVGEYPESWDRAKNPIAVIHWGKPSIIGISKAGRN
jgi:hypothetical protein